MVPPNFPISTIYSTKPSILGAPDVEKALIGGLHPRSSSAEVLHHHEPSGGFLHQCQRDQWQRSLQMGAHGNFASFQLLDSYFWGLEHGNRGCLDHLGAVPMWFRWSLTCNDLCRDVRFQERVWPSCMPCECEHFSKPVMLDEQFGTPPPKIGDSQANLPMMKVVCACF